MKRILAFFVVILSVSSPEMTAQPQVSLSVHGGYSWVIGFAGADLQAGRFALSAGWVPTSMPLSKERVHSYSGALTYYQPLPVLKGFSGYISLGGTTKGYRFEDSWGGKSTLPILIGTAGVKYELGRFWLRGGGGYGWCKESDSFTFETSLGFKIFRN